MNKYEIFWGGTDVNPALYNQIKHKTTQKPDEERDKKEKTLFNLCIINKTPMIGICRGAQFLNVMNGGTLIQDIHGHTRGHTVITDDNEQFYVTSTHHQMMVPTKEAKILAIDKRKVLCLDSPTGNTYSPKEGIEVVYYPKTLSLCIQFHPEFMHPGSQAVLWVHKKVKELFNINNLQLRDYITEYNSKFRGMI